MQQNRLMKQTAVLTSFFAAAVMAVILYYSMTKVVVVTGVAQDEVVHSMGIAKQEEISEQIQDKNRLTFVRNGEQTARFGIPLPQSVTAENVIIENHYMDRELWVSIQDEAVLQECEAFYQTTGMYGNHEAVLDGYYESGKDVFWLKFRLNNIYEYNSVFEDNNLFIEFMTPKEVYDKVVIIDPAYGGIVTGASANEVFGKDVALRVTRALKEKLDKTDIKVYYTRMNDTNPTDENRVSLANAAGADMMIRIEVNENPNQNVFGTETVYNGSYFIPEFGNVELADLLEREVVTAISGKANGLIESTEEDSVLNQIEIPSATIRVGYVSNETEAALLKREDYAQKIAEGIYQTILKAYEE